MPKYDALPVLDDINALAAQHAKKPLADPVAEVSKVLKKYAKLGIENAKTRLAYVTKLHDEAKSTLAEMNKRLQDIQSPGYLPEPYKLAEIKAGAEMIRLMAQKSHEDSSTMFDLMKQYRENWTGTIRKLCPDTGFADTYIAIRTQSMIYGNQAVGQEERLEEYVKRAEGVLKQAEKARNGAQSSLVEMQKEATQFVADFKAAEDAVDRVVKATDGRLTTLVGHKKLSTYTGKEYKVSESFVQDIETQRKAVSGKFKTAREQFKALTDAARANPAVYADAVKRGQQTLQTIQKQLDRCEQIKSSAQKTLAELAKRIGK